MYTFLDETNFRYICLYQVLVRSHLEYTKAVWSPFTKKDIDTIENVQKRATQLISSLQNMDYTNQLKKAKNANIKIQKIKRRYY